MWNIFLSLMICFGVGDAAWFEHDIYRPIALAALAASFARPKHLIPLSCPAADIWPQPAPRLPPAPSCSHLGACEPCRRGDPWPGHQQICWKTTRAACSAEISCDAEQGSVTVLPSWTTGRRERGYAEGGEPGGMGSPWPSEKPSVNTLVLLTTTWVC